MTYNPDLDSDKHVIVWCPYHHLACGPGQFKDKPNFNYIRVYLAYLRGNLGVFKILFFYKCMLLANQTWFFFNVLSNTFVLITIKAYLDNKHCTVCLKLLSLKFTINWKQIPLLLLVKLTVLKRLKFHT